MSYRPIPGTIQHKAVEWLRAMANLYPDRWHATPELCAGIDVDVATFTAYMAPCRTHGLVQTMKREETGKLLYWRAGDGKPEPVQREVAEFDAKIDASQQGLRRDLEPRDFRALRYQGRLLVTGMRVIDGVAVFEPEQVLQLKRTTDWWRAEA